MKNKSKEEVKKDWYNINGVCVHLVKADNDLYVNGVKVPDVFKPELKQKGESK